MKHFSLIIATLGRTEELNTLFASIYAQDFEGVECILVDQNPDDRLAAIVERWSAILDLRWVRATPGLSRARNIGLQFARGRIVAFPDDDCAYTPSLLYNVSRWFWKNGPYGILTVGAQDEDGVPSGNRWIQDHCIITPANAFRTTFASTIFLLRDIAMQCRFDEALGVGAGTAYASGEETDYILRLLQLGTLGFFDRTWHILHPRRDMLSGEIDSRRATKYGSGMGYVLRKNNLPVLGAAFVAYDVARSMLIALRGDLKAATLSLQHGWGLAKGFLAAPAAAAALALRGATLADAYGVLSLPISEGQSAR